MIKYDYTIIGAGPTGLAIAWILSQYNKTVLVIDREDTIGGCHRVRRVDDYFTEHGPRIYSTIYLNTKILLEKMNMKFDDYFTKYDFNFTTIGGSTIQNMPFKELFWFGIEFIKLMFNDKYSKSVTCDEFMNKHNFSEETKDYIDRICRFTDGAGANKYTLYEFLQLANQNFGYQVLQPVNPNDIGLFNDMQRNMENTNKIHFMMDSQVTQLINDDNGISDIIVRSNNGSLQIKTNNVIIATPPSNLIDILGNSGPQIKNAFGNYDTLQEWTIKNKYNAYISIVYHWDKELDLPKVWGFPSSEWGIAYIVLTDYMNFKNTNSKTVISAVISIFDVLSNTINKIPDECTEQELIEETFRQLKISYPNLKEPTSAIMSPGVYWDDNKSMWISQDDAYMITTDISKDYTIKFQSDLYNNLYSVGTHSGHSIYSITSMESAITNAFAFCHQLIPGSKEDYPIEGPRTLIDYIKMILMVIVAIIGMIFIML